MTMTIPPCIWVCDSAEWWVEIFREFLRGRRMVMQTFPTVRLLLAEAAIAAPPRLTLLGCTRIDADIGATVATLRRHDHEVIVLTAVERLSTVRSLFRVGAADVIPRFADLTTLASIVDDDRRAQQLKGSRRWKQPSA